MKNFSLSVKVSENLYKRLSKAAQRQDISVSALIRYTMSQKLDSLDAEDSIAKNTQRQ